MGLVPATSPLKSFHEGTGRMDLPHRVCVAETIPTKSNQFEFLGQVAGAKIWSLRLDFLSKIASSHDGTCPRDLLQGQVARTSPLVCTNVKV